MYLFVYDNTGSVKRKHWFSDILLLLEPEGYYYCEVDFKLFSYILTCLNGCSAGDLAVDRQSWCLDIISVF